MNKKKIKLSLYILLFIVGIVLLFLPKDFFDSGQAICLSVVLFDTECFGCGMTRAIQHLIHFDFVKAWEFNMLSFIVLPMAAFLILKDFIKLLVELRKEKK